MPGRLRVLLIEDSEDDAVLIADELRRGGLDVSTSRVETAEAVKAELRSARYDVVISDYSLPRFSAPAALKLLKETGQDIPFIAVSGAVTETIILEVMKAGAADYVMKDNLRRLPSAVEREVREAELRRQQKRLEERLLQAHKLEAIGRLAGEVAHDFNNLLTGIMGFASLASEDLPEAHPSKSRIDEVLAISERGKALTRQLLTFSRKHVSEPQTIGLNHVVSGLESLLRRLIGERIELMVATSDAGKIRVDPNQLGQVLMNLVVNARDAMPGGGRVTIETSRAELQGAAAAAAGLEPGPYSCVSVRDTGSGMSEETRAHLFEPFFTTKERGKGTGLGLSTAYGVIRHAGGSIVVSSELGEGTEVSVYLPMVEGAVSEREARRPVQPSGALCARVLVVEDDQLIRGLISSVLTRAGHKVIEASRPSEALKNFESAQTPFQLVISDIIMPDMTGPEMVARMLKSAPRLCVLYVSGYPAESFGTDTLSAVTSALLPKPFLPDDLLRKVQELLTGGDRRHARTA